MKRERSVQRSARPSSDRTVHEGDNRNAPHPSSGGGAGFDFAALPVYSPDRPQVPWLDGVHAPGPFAPEVNALLGSAFGEPLDRLGVTRGADAFNEAIGARASTVGSHIYLGSGIEERLGNPESLEVLAHEVSHALAAPRRAETLLDRPGDVGERQAGEAGRSVRAAAESGWALPVSAPVASGGQAAVHRFESGEHRRAVDEAIANRGPGAAVDPAVRAQLEARMTLANGVEVSPGQITAMMGDFYGQFDKKGNFDPAASFEQLNNADPEEMRALMDAIAREEKGEHIKASEWEAITSGRRGEGNLSYLELAQRNRSHFSGPTMTGTDNNMGTYTAFHQMALQAAQDGDLERARALEASSMHYLTDRHAGGHSIDKEGVANASGFRSSPVLGDELANGAVKIVHDDLNAHGATVANADGEGWRAYGDGHWDAFRDEDGNLIDPNAENRSRTGESVYTSYSELAAVASGARSAEDVERGGYGAHRTVPQFDPSRQADAERAAGDLSWHEVARENAGDVPDAAYGRYVRRPLGKAVDWAEDTAREAWEGVKGAANWVGDKAGGAWDWASDKARAGADWVGEKASDAWNGAQRAADWAGDRVNDAGEWVGEKASGAADWVGEKASAAWGAAQDAGDWAINTAGDAAGWVGDQASGAADWVGDKAGDALDWGGERIDDAAGLLRRLVPW